MKVLRFTVLAYLLTFYLTFYRFILLFCHVDVLSEYLTFYRLKRSFAVVFSLVVRQCYICVLILCTHPTLSHVNSLSGVLVDSVHLMVLTYIVLIIAMIIYSIEVLSYGA